MSGSIEMFLKSHCKNRTDGEKVCSYFLAQIPEIGVWSKKLCLKPAKN